MGADQLSPDQQAKAYRAAQRGEVHPDPVIRAAALRIASHRVTGAVRQRRFLVVVGVLVALSAVVNLLAGNVSSAVAGFVGAGAFGVVLRQWATARRRAAELVRASDGT
ncbi:hypothetical protein [Kribbella lupini]|uniref:hypothetical protein n=1 Tax=Kribbella lupini TaxID=291602 RepID=UPI0031D4DA88